MWCWVTHAASTCTGVVYDVYGEPIIGASVVISGSTTGALTDMDGMFAIPCDPNAKQTLNFSDIGYHTYELCTVARSGISVTLCEDQGETPDLTCLGASCGSSSSGGTTTCTSCPDCSDTDWTAGNTGYEYRIIATCNTITCTCTKTTEYRCANGYYGTATSDTSGCTLCPADSCCGQVLDTSSGPLPGTSVIITNQSSIGAVTDAYGYFQLALCSSETPLTFLLLGYVRQEVTPTTANYSNMSIVMQDDYGVAFCDAGYYMDWSTEKSACAPCPENGTIANNNGAVFNNRITDCYLPIGTAFSDTVGSGQYSAACYYSD